MFSAVPRHTPNIILSVSDDLQKWPLWGVGGLFSLSPPVAPSLSREYWVQLLFNFTPVSVRQV